LIVINPDGNFNQISVFALKPDKIEGSAVISFVSEVNFEGELPIYILYFSYIYIL
jgi:hypothetical protein